MIDDQTIVSEGAVNATSQEEAAEAGAGKNANSERSAETASNIVHIPRGPWDIDLDTVMYVTSYLGSGGGVVVATSKGGFVLTANEAEPFMRFVKEADK